MHRIFPASEEDIEELLSMSLDLWPDYTPAALQTTLLDILSSEKVLILIYSIGGAHVAFIYIGIRVDYVEGPDSSPTGFVEGIYVKPGYRRTGIARQMLQHGEQWLREKGCTQIGSDIYSDNTASYSFHTGIGFREAGRLIAFIKNL